MTVEEPGKRYVFNGKFGNVKKDDKVLSPIDIDEFDRLLDSFAQARIADAK